MRLEYIIVIDLNSTSGYESHLGSFAVQGGDLGVYTGEGGYTVVEAEARAVVNRHCFPPGCLRHQVSALVWRQQTE